jgi:hypothetical protein
MTSLTFDGLKSLPASQREVAMTTYRASVASISARRSLALTNVDLRAAAARDAHRCSHWHLQPEGL